MKIFTIIALILIVSSCGCNNKAKILQERQNTINSIKKKHGEYVIPPSIYEVPDFSECD